VIENEVSKSDHSITKAACGLALRQDSGGTLPFKYAPRWAGWNCRPV
jgi:hypothetical protein